MTRRLCRSWPAGGVEIAALAPLVDMLTLLVVFLLRAWAADPPVRPGDAAFRLPVSVAERPVRQGLAVDIAGGGIYLQGERVDGAEWYMRHPDDLVRGLYDALLASPRGPLLLRAGREVPYRLLRKALFTARQAGFTDVELVAASASGL